MRVWFVIISLLVCTLGAWSRPPTAALAQAPAPPPSPDRVVHRFDFDERPEGNLEETPKYWEPIRPPRFPHFAHGEFDDRIGHDAPPSFRLVTEGRNVAYEYTGPDTRIRANTDYRIEAYIRPDRLQRARACLTAHLLDQSGRPMVDTLVRSDYVGGKGSDGRWVRIDLSLSAASRDAHAIALTAWVLQEDVWSTETKPSRYIHRRDVHGAAWFDDITIYALPHVKLSTSAPGNVLAPDGPQFLDVVLADEVESSLTGRLSITAADGGLVEQRDMPVVVGRTPTPTRVAVGRLAPGLYHAKLEVRAGATLVTSQTLSFARLAPRLRSTEARARPFGVVISPSARSDVATELALLVHQSVGSTKLPVWTGTAADPADTIRPRDTDRFLQSLVKRGFDLTGVFFAAPRAIAAGDGTYQRPLIELLAGDPATWNEPLAAVVAPFAGAFRSWQLGSDSAPPEAPADQIERAFRQLRSAMRPFIAAPRLSIPLASHSLRAIRSTAGETVNDVSLVLSPEIGMERLASDIATLKETGYERVSVYTTPLPADRYRRIPRLARWAQQTITARHAGADTVFVSQPWHVREISHGRVTEPVETYILLRTIADMLGSAMPGPSVRVARHVHCLAFRDAETMTLALWDPDAPTGGNSYPLQVGKAHRQIDMWGRSRPLERAPDGRRIVRLTAMPVFVPGVEPWLIDFRTSITWTPNHVESGDELVRHTIEMAYAGDRPVSGKMEFHLPSAWEALPRQFTFAVSPQRVSRHTVTMRYPHSESAGDKDVPLLVTLAPSGYRLVVPLPLNVGLSDLRVSGSAFLEDRDVLLRHTITNRASEVLSFRASASLPGRQRQYRPITNLAPGQTQTVEYRFRDAFNLVGRVARLGLNEVNPPQANPRIHNLERIIP